jgi:carbonyl reductase 1
MKSSRTAVVTGATQGLGLALVEGLAARLGPDDLVLLTGRDPDRVRRAVAALGPTSAPVQGRVLDVAEPDTIEDFVADLAAERGGVDVFISNAAARMSPDADPADEVDAVVATNNLATLRVLRAVPPVLRPGGRLLVVASGLGTLDHLDRRLWPLFEDARSLEEVERVVRDWQRAVHDGSAVSLGWPRWLNVPSKVAQVAAVRVAAAARRERDLPEGILLASVCPGLIDTDASRPWFLDMSGAQSPARAAVALLDLALARDVDPAHYGELVRFGAVLPWRDGAPAEPATRS